MEDGQKVAVKVPNPNAGILHFTTASEVGTLDFVYSSYIPSTTSLLARLNLEARKVLDTPVPHVYLWNSQVKSHPVGVEFIIMDKAEGVPLS